MISRHSNKCAEGYLRPIPECTDRIDVLAFGAQFVYRLPVWQRSQFTGPVREFQFRPAKSKSLAKPKCTSNFKFDGSYPALAWAWREETRKSDFTTTGKKSLQNGLYEQSSSLWIR